MNLINLELTSKAFQQGYPIPKTYTEDGKDISPPLHWNDAPDGAKSLALICDDPDAPRRTWAHWIVFNLPTEARELPEGLPRQETLPNGGVQGMNDFGDIGYDGPAPPPGKPHRYFFKLFALDEKLNLHPGATRHDVQEAMDGHILAEGLLMGTYTR